ncbi:hypothetical protein M422DRAFT_238881 [Sphaerobolus stellatus SS14]|nr:hypothetical protein M422DRAFT_238881 [Sphaerobolus stellatus SS14]
MSPTFRQLPPLSYTLQNLLISVASAIGSILSFIFTLIVYLPASLVRTIAYLPSTIHGLFRRKWINLSDRSRNILVIGASEGLGKQIVEEYIIDPDTTIVAVSRHTEGLEEMRRALSAPREFVAKVHFETLDIGTVPPANIHHTMTKWQDRYGAFSHVFSVTGTTAGEAPWSLQTTLNIIQTNIIGNVSIVLSAYDLMQRNAKGGKICVIGSQAGFQDHANMITYAATKAFLNTFIISLRVLALFSRAPLSNTPLGASSPLSLSRAHPEARALDERPPPIEVTLLSPGLMSDIAVGRLLRDQGSKAPVSLYKNPTRVAREVKRRVEGGGVGVITWPWGQGVILWGSRALNPLIEQSIKWVMWKSGVASEESDLS